MDNRETVLLRLPRPLKQQIEACAKQNLRSMTREIEQAVRVYLHAQRERAQ